jgi:hypothetical protein
MLKEAELSLVYVFLSPADIARAGLSCQRWRYSSEANFLWKDIYLRKWGPASTKEVLQATQQGHVIVANGMHTHSLPCFPAGRIQGLQWAAELAKERKFNGPESWQKFWKNACLRKIFKLVQIYGSGVR